MGLVRRGDNFRRNIPEAQKFIYPDDSQRITGKDARDGAALLGGAALEGLGRLGIPVPFRAVLPFAKKIKQVANRPDATPSMHRIYLGNKYGSDKWDVYVNNQNKEVRNDLYHYNEQDLGNGSTFTQRENKRFAGEALSDEWLEDIKAHGIEQDMLEERVETNRQEKSVRDYFGDKAYEAFVDPSNPSISAEQQLSRALLSEGQSNPTIQPDRFLGKFVDDSIKRRQSGINNRFQDDSEIRREVQGQYNDDGTIDLIREDNPGDEIYTEVLSPSGVERLYSEFAENAEFRSPNEFFWQPGTPDASRRAFNEAGGEYYGQQALRMKGAKAPKADQRSSKNQRDVFRGQFRTEDAYELAKQRVNSMREGDRLIEGSPDLVGKPHQYQGDYRFVGQDGKVHVSDYQTRDKNDGSISLSVLKGSSLEPGDQVKLNRMLKDAAMQTGSSSLDEQFKYLIDSGQIEGVYPGKFLADGTPLRHDFESDFDHIAGSGTETEVNQRRIEDVVYGISEKDHIESQYGMMPQKLINLDGQSTRDLLGQRIMDSRGLPGQVFIGDNGSVNVTVNTRTDAPAMVNPEQMAILSEPYSFNEAMAQEALHKNHQRRFWGNDLEETRTLRPIDVGELRPIGIRDPWY